MMTAALNRARRQIEVCVEVGAPVAHRMPHGGEVDAVAAAVMASPRLRLAGVAGCGRAGPRRVARGVERILHYLNDVRSAAERLAVLVDGPEFIVTAGGSTHFDLVADALAGHWRTILRSGPT